jgi:hypothetical protein
MIRNNSFNFHHRAHRAQRKAKIDLQQLAVHGGHFTTEAQRHRGTEKFRKEKPLKTCSGFA